MKKVIILSITLMTIIIGLLCGCTTDHAGELSDTEQNFVGTWITSEFYMQWEILENGTTNFFDILKFFSDKTCSISSENYAGTWAVKNGKLVITTSEKVYTYDFDFATSSTRRSLDLTDVNDGKTWDYTKQ